MKSVITAIIVAAVISGSAGAASLLFDGSKLKNHSVPVTKLTASAVSSLHGQRGARGALGPQGAQGDPLGPQGAQGAQGAQGVAGPPGLSGYVSGIGGSGSTVWSPPGAQGTAINLCPSGPADHRRLLRRSDALRAAHGGRLALDRRRDRRARVRGHDGKHRRGRRERPRPAALRSRFLRLEPSKQKGRETGPSLFLRVGVRRRERGVA